MLQRVCCFFFFLISFQNFNSVFPVSYNFNELNLLFACQCFQAEYGHFFYVEPRKEVFERKIKTSFRVDTAIKFSRIKVIKVRKCFAIYLKISTLSIRSGFTNENRCIMQNAYTYTK